jgi:hypothetical protein
MPRFRTILIIAAFAVSLICLIDLRLMGRDAPRHADPADGYKVMRVLRHPRAPPESIWLTATQARRYDLMQDGVWAGPVVAVVCFVFALFTGGLRRRSGW